jgi:hypothetical protein
LRNVSTVRGGSRISHVEHRAPAPLKLLESSRKRIEPYTPNLPGVKTQPLNPAELEALDLEGWLPINLRRFLIEEMGPMLRFDVRTVRSARGSGSEALTRELARAIRRYSFNRSREIWSECIVAASWLEQQIGRSPAGRNPVVLCLRCARVSRGCEAVKEHWRSGCVAVALNAGVGRGGTDPKEDAKALLRHGLYEVIERFRLVRAEAGLPHYDLDCYVPGGNVVFNWRPLAPTG